MVEICIWKIQEVLNCPTGYKGYGASREEEVSEREDKEEGIRMVSAKVWKREKGKNRSSCHETRTSGEIGKQRYLGGSLTAHLNFVSKPTLSFNVFAIGYVSIECYMLKLSLNAI